MCVFTDRKPEVVFLLWKLENVQKSVSGKTEIVLFCTLIHFISERTQSQWLIYGDTRSPDTEMFYQV